MISKFIYKVIRIKAGFVLIIIIIYHCVQRDKDDAGITGVWWI